MPRIEHIAMWVRDLDTVCSFYARHFGAKVGPRYANPAKGFASRFLSFDDGSRLEVMTTSAFVPDTAPAGVERMGLAHLAIALPSEDAVRDSTARLREAGCTVVAEPRRTGDGYYESVVLDPEGNRIEITAAGPGPDPLPGS